MITDRAHFTSAYESVALARRFVGGFARSCGFEAPAVSDIVLAVGEAGSNAVEHGHVPNGVFRVACSFDGFVLRIEVRDGGRGFEPPANGFEKPDGSVGRGRGLSIMRALMDFVACRRTADGTTVLLEKRLLGRGRAEAAEKPRGVDARSAGQPR